MNAYHDYESWGQQTFRTERPESLDNPARLNESRLSLLETFDGPSIVEWWHKIRTQLKRLVKDADKARNFSYVDKLRKFIEIWDANKLDGSVNIEPLNALYAAAAVLGEEQNRKAQQQALIEARRLAEDTWNLAGFFSELAAKLDKVIASTQALPGGVDMDQNEPMMGGGGGGGAGGGPPMSPAFGAEEEPPPGAEGGAGGPGGMPGPGMPGAEQGGAPGEEGSEGEEGAEGVPPPDEMMPPSAAGEPAPQPGALGGEPEGVEPGEEEQIPERI